MLESSLTVIVTVISGVIVYVLTELLKEDERVCAERWLYD